jgi:hypothetical protein
VDWTNLAQDEDELRADVNAIVNIYFQKKRKILEWPSDRSFLKKDSAH